MKVPDDCTCKTCRKIFCCSHCREQHEVKNHAIVVRVAKAETQNLAHLFCPICEKKPLVLRKDMYDEILEHIENHHLPLHCRKCAKVYHQIDDLRDFSLCTPAQDGKGNQECCVTDQSCETDATKSTVTKGNSQSSISTQTSPMRHFNDSHATPISLLNMRWKARNKITQEEFISDSVSSIRNISSISNSSLRRSIGVVTNKGKLVRSTSTPVQAECCIKPKEQTFNASSGQVSSIYNSACESDVSPAPQNPINTPAKQSLDVNRYRKVGVRPKMSAVTPLRHVMSKSIQKAIAAHGAPIENGSNAVVIGSPLDLRLSPAIRRTQSEISCSSNSEILSTNKQSSALRKELLFSTQKLTTESIVITRTEHLSNMESISSGSNTNTSSVKMNYLSDIANSLSAASNLSVRNSVYKTCHSVEIITATEVSEVSVNQQEQTNGQMVNNETQQLPPITPITRIPGAAINKKIIQFDTPKLGQDQTNVTHPEISADEKFYTPEATPKRKSSLKSPSLERDCVNIKPRNLIRNYEPMRRPPLQICSSNSSFTRIENLNDPYDDEVFLSNEEATKLKNAQEPTERTWSLSSIMSSMIRFPSLRGNLDKDRQETKSDSSAGSLIKRCASIAGSLIRSKTLADENPANSLKRKRTYTTDSSHFRSGNSGYNASTSPNGDYEFNITSKRFRIQGRKPIERMRQNS